MPGSMCRCSRAASRQKAAPAAASRWASAGTVSRGRRSSAGVSYQARNTPAACTGAVMTSSATPAASGCHWPVCSITVDASTSTASDVPALSASRSGRSSPRISAQGAAPAPKSRYPARPTTRNGSRPGISPSRPTITAARATAEITNRDRAVAADRAACRAGVKSAAPGAVYR